MAKGKGGMAATTNLKQGTRHTPRGVDKSMACKGASVNAGSTRKSTAPTPRSLGPREA